MFEKVFLLDLLERSVSTFVQAFAASLIVVGLDDVKVALSTSAIAGVLAVAKALTATKVGAEDSAALLPAKSDPPLEDVEDR